MTVTYSSCCKIVHGIAEENVTPVPEVSFKTLTIQSDVNALTARLQLFKASIVNALACKTWSFQSLVLL